MRMMTNRERIEKALGRISMAREDLENFEVDTRLWHLRDDEALAEDLEMIAGELEVLINNLQILYNTVEEE
jgi:hypothetical protein